MDKVDDKFYNRADEHIDVSNSQLKDIGSGKVSASMMYATARFNSWISACGFESANDMLELRNTNIEYFVTEYRKMLEENMDDYIANFEDYMRSAKDDT